MPANFNPPREEDFARYLQSLLGKGYGVSYVDRRNEQGERDPRQGFYHITQQGGRAGALSTNLRINLGFASNFRTDYGQGGVPGPEYAPEILTRSGDSGYTIGGTWQTRYKPVQTPGTKGWRGRQNDFVGEDFITSPTQNLAGIISNAFQETRQQIGQGSTSASVYGNVMEMLAEGETGAGRFRVPRGALLTTRNDVNATRMRAAQSLGLVNIFDTSSEVHPIEQTRRLNMWRTNVIEQERQLPAVGGQSAISSFFKRLGYSFDRDNPERLVPMAQGFRGSGNDTEIYLPTSKVAKHRTLLDVGRQIVSPLDENNRVIQPQSIPYRGSPVGYRQTTADVGGRVPQNALIAGTVFSSQGLAGGAGDYFPANAGVNISNVGYQRPITTALTGDVGGLLADEVGLKFGGVQPGQTISPLSRFEVGSVQVAGSDEYTPVRQRTGASAYTVGGQSLRIPQYYHAISGAGLPYNEEAINVGVAREVTEAQRARLEKQYGMPVQFDPTLSQVTSRIEGMSLVGAKFGGAGVKTDPVGQAGAPVVNVNAPGLTPRQLPITMSTWEAKSLPETFITSLAAQPRRAQLELLQGYHGTLEPDSRAALGLGETIGMLQNAGRGDRLSIDRMAMAMGMPAHEIGRGILETQILGMPISHEDPNVRQLANLSEQELREFAQSPANLRNLSKYNTGFVSSEMTTPVTQTWDMGQYNLLRDEYMAYANSPEGMKALGLQKPLSQEAATSRFNTTYGFDPSSAQGGQIGRTYRPEGFYMPVIGGPSAEFPGGGTLGIEDINVMNQVMPSFANRLGLSLRDINSAGALTRAENIRNPVRWAQAQTAMLSMIESSRGDDQIVIPEALTVSKGQALSMLGDTGLMETLQSDKYANLAGLQRFQELFTKYYPDFENKEDLLGRVIQFEGREGHYMPSSRAIGFLGAEDVATRAGGEHTGEDLTRMWNMYRTAFSKNIEGSVNDDVSGMAGGMLNLNQQLMNMYGLPFGDKRNSVKGLLASDVQATKSRYAFWQDLKQEEVFGSKSLYQGLIRRELSGQGIEPSEAEVEEIYRMISGQGKAHGGKIISGKTPNYIESMGVPGYVQRYPQVAGEESGWAARFITPEHLQRQGRSLPAETGMGSQHFRMGLGLSSIFQGDFDLDMMMGMLGITGKRTKSGRLKIGFAGFDKDGVINPGVARAVERTATATYSQIQKMLFPNMAQNRQFNPIYQGFLDRGREGLLGVSQNLIQSQFGKAAYYPYKVLSESIKNYTGAKMQMGQTYDFTRMMEMQQEAAGWTQTQQMRGRRGRAEIYQPFLDVMSGVPQPIVNMFQTSYMAQNDSGTGIGWAYPRQNMNDPLTFIARAATNASINPNKALSTLGLMAGTALTPNIRDEVLSPQTFASYFSPEGGRAFTPELDQQEAEFRSGIRGSMDEALSRGRMDDYEEMAQQYYSQVSLEEALTPAFERQGSALDRSFEMRRDYQKWLEVNYGDRPEAGMRAPIYSGMFSKAYAKKMTQDYEFGLPQSFLGTAAGQDLMERHSVAKPGFDMSRGRLFGADVALKAMRSLQGSNRLLGNLGNWMVGSIQNTLALGQTRTNREFGALYQEAMSQPIELRGGNLSGLVGLEPKYPDATTLGPVDAKDYQEQSLRKAGAYMLGSVLGVKPSDTYTYTGALFPTNENQQQNFDRGNLAEAQIGDVMAERKWFSKTRYRRNSFGEMEPSQTDSPGGYQGALLWSGEVGGERVNAASTPDFMRLVKDKSGEDFVQFIEQKAPQGTWTEQDYLKKKKPGQNLQAQYNVWIAQQLRKDIQGGGEAGATAEASLRRFIGTYVPGESDRERVYESIMAGRMGSSLFVTPEGGEALTEAAKGVGTADPTKIEALLAADPYETRYTMSPSGDDPEMRNVQSKVEQAVANISSAKPRIFSQLWDIVQGGNEHWLTARNEAAQQGLPTAPANTALDYINRIRDRMRAIGTRAREAVQQGTPSGPTPTADVSTLQSHLRETYGPAFAQIAGLIPDITRNNASQYYGKIQQDIAQVAGSGAMQEFQAVPGIGMAEQRAVYEEAAQQMGYNPRFEMGEQGFSMGIGRTYRTRVRGRGFGAFMPDVPVGGGTVPPMGGGLGLGGNQSNQSGAPGGGPTGGGPTGGIPGAMHVPPAGSGGPYDPFKTGQAISFHQQYSRYGGDIIRTAGDVRSRLGVSGSSPMDFATQLSGMAPEDVANLVRDLAPEIVRATNLTKLAPKVKRAMDESVDPARVPMGALGTMVGNATTTTGAMGEALTELTSLFEHLSTDDKRAFKKAARGGDKIEPTADILEEKFRRLAIQTEKITEAYKSQENDLSKTAEAFKTIADAKIEKKRIGLQGKIEEAAAPLLASGFLARDDFGKFSLGDISAPATMEQLAKFGEATNELQEFDMAGQMAAQEGKGLGGFFRRTLGGFGMMYMRSIFGFATQGLDYGSQERQALEMQMAGTSGALTGAGALPYNQSQRLANQRALYGYDQQLIPEISTWARTTPGVSDITNMASAGLGTFGLASWLGGQLPDGANSWLSKGAGLLGVGSAVVSLGASAVQKSRDVEGLGYRWGTGGFWQNFNVSDILATGFNMGGQRGIVSESAGAYGTIAENLNYTPAQIAEFFGGGATGQATTMSRIQRVLLGENLDISPEALGGAFLPGTMAGLRTEQIPQLARLSMATGFQASSLEQMLMSQGMSYQQAYDSGMMNQGLNRALGGGFTAMQAANMGIGAQATAALGSAGAYATQYMDFDQRFAYNQQIAGIYGTPQFGAYQGAMNVWAGWQQLGRSSQQPDLSQFEEMSPFEIGVRAAEDRNQTAQQARISSMSDILAQYLGWDEGGAMSAVGLMTEGMDLGELDQMGGRFNQMAQIMSNARRLNPNMSDEQIAQIQQSMFSSSYTGGTSGLVNMPRTMDVILGAQQGDPFARTQAYAQGIQVPGMQITPGMVQRDIFGTGMEGSPFEGMAVNAAPFTVSGASHPWFQFLEPMLGQGSFSGGVGGAFAGGYSMQGTNLPALGGMMGMKMYMADQQYQLQQANLGISGAYQALQREYLPQMWAVQDQQRALQYEQAQYGFSHQLEGLAMSRRQFGEQEGLRLTQSTLQRGWAREDWRFQDQQRAQQWGWKVEDFQENLRFMTGRDRRMAERQMSRETIVKGQEDERIDEQRKRQEELWALEDERFDMQRQHFEENKKFQEEAIQKQKEFFEEQFRLQEEAIRLQRELTMKQLELQEQSLGIQKEMLEANRKQQEIQMAMEVLSIMLTTSEENRLLLAEQLGVEADEVFGTMDKYLQQWFEGFGGYGTGGGGGGSEWGDNWPTSGSGSIVPKPSQMTTSGTAAWGDESWAGLPTWVGESGPEILRMTGSSLNSRKRGEIIPSGNYDPWQSQQLGNTTVTPPPSDTVIIVNVGNEELKRYVVNAVGDEL